MAKLHSFIYKTCCSACIKLCAEPRHFKSLNHIPPSKGTCYSSGESKHYRVLIKTINMLINIFRAIWAKLSKIKSFSSESQQKKYLQSCCVFQCSWFLQGHSQSWGVAMVRRGCGCTMLGPAGSLGASVITYLIKDKTAVQQLWEKTMRKKRPWEKSHCRHQGQGRSEGGGLAATPFPRAMDCFVEKEAEKPGENEWIFAWEKER